MIVHKKCGYVSKIWEQVSWNSSSQRHEEMQKQAESSTVYQYKGWKIENTGWLLH